MGVLSGVRVIDLTYGGAGPYATQLLADMGADIIRVDAPDDPVRGRAGAPTWLRGRRSIIADTQRPESRPLLEALVRDTDVLLVEAAPGRSSPVALDYEALSRHNARLVYCRITPYGDDGPLADDWGHEHLVGARHGVFDQPGWRDGPTFLTAPVPALGAALLAVQAIGTALYIRERTGEGQEVSTTLLAGALAFQPAMVHVERQPGAGRMEPSGLAVTGRQPLGVAPFYSIYECADGEWLHFGCLTPDFIQKALLALGLEEVLSEPRFGNGRNIPTPEARRELIEMVTARMKTKTYADWAAVFEAADVPHARSQWTEDLFDDAQVQHEGLIIETQDPEVGRIQLMGAAVTFAAEPYAFPGPTPLPGQHTDAVCRDAGLDSDAIARLRRLGVIQ